MFRRRLVEKKTVAVKFDGELEEVSVDTFVSVLLGYSRVLQEAAGEVDPGMRLDVNITATRPGCLEAILTAAMNDVPGLLGTLATMSGQISQVIDTTHKYLELRRFLGKKGAPKEIASEAGGVRITAGDGSTFVVNNYVYNLSGSAAASAAAASMFTAGENDEHIEALLISSEGSEAFKATREEFPQLKTAPECAVGSQRVNVMERAVLSVTKPVLEASTKRKWELYWQGFKISATVADQEFFGKLERHEYAFGIGDNLIADLEVTQHLNAQDVWENKGYRILKVHDVINQGRTQQMDL